MGENMHVRLEGVLPPTPPRHFQSVIEPEGTYPIIFDLNASWSLQIACTCMVYSPHYETDNQLAPRQLEMRRLTSIAEIDLQR